MLFRAPRSFPNFPQTAYVLVALGVVWMFFLIRVYDLQVANRQIYKVKSEENRIVRLTKLAPRGEILDRAGRVLAASRFSTDLVTSNRRLKTTEINALCSRLAPLLTVRPDRLRDAYFSAIRKTYSYQPVPLYSNLSETQTIRVGEALWQFPDLRLQKRLTRWYPGGDLLSHVLGYVNEVSKEDMDRDPNYKLGSLIGRSGIEDILEPHLRGKDGYRWGEVDAQGKMRRDLTDLPEAEATAGATVRLTIDYELSKALEEAFGDSNGFGVLMNASTGAIRAMFSRPGFDPNRLVTTDIEYIRQLQTDSARPFFNRAVQSSFPPGSTYKTVNFVAAVESGLADENTSFYCSGQFHIGKRVAECWKTRGHGRMTLLPAITQSCNIYFYNLGMVLGVERMAAYGRMFKLGEKTGFILPGEPDGILPTPEWKQRRFGEAWTRGDDVNMSIGQGFVLVTPLQQVSLMASLFNGGKIMKPYLVEAVWTQDARDPLSVPGEAPTVRGTLTVSDTTLALLRTGLREVVLHGTGTRAGRDPRGKLLPVEVYGKTGTVQRVGRQTVERVGVEPEDHGWFLCYFVLNGEPMTAVVMKESAGHGGTVAAPVIGRFIANTYRPPS